MKTITRTDDSGTVYSFDVRPFTGRVFKDAGMAFGKRVESAPENRVPWDVQLYVRSCIVLAALCDSFTVTAKGKDAVSYPCVEANLDETMQAGMVVDIAMEAQKGGGSEAATPDPNASSAITAST